MSVRWMAVAAVADTAEECRKRLDEMAEGDSINKHALIIDRFMDAPIRGDSDWDYIVVRRTAVASAILGSLEVKP